MKDLLTVVLGENDMQTTVPNNGTKKNNDLVNLIYESGTPARGEASSIHDTQLEEDGEMPDRTVRCTTCAISHRDSKGGKVFEDSKINLLDLPIREDMIQTKGGHEQINLLMKPINLQGNQRRITGNTTISSNNSLMNRTSDLIELGGKFTYGTKLSGTRGFFTGTIGTMMANQNDTQQTELSEISNGGSHTPKMNLMPNKNQ